MGKVQVRKTKCCGAIRAACIEPDCYTDSEWIRDTKKHVLNGGSVEMVESGTWEFTKCTCKKVKKAETENLFTEV